jgi:hypothetical protein
LLRQGVMICTGPPAAADRAEWTLICVAHRAGELTTASRGARNACSDERGPKRKLRPPPSVSIRSVGGLEGVHDSLRDPAPVGDLVAVLPGPCPDRGGLLANEGLRSS